MYFAFDVLFCLLLSATNDYLYVNYGINMSQDNVYLLFCFVYFNCNHMLLYFLCCYNYFDTQMVVSYVV